MNKKTHKGIKILFIILLILTASFIVLYIGDKQAVTVIEENEQRAIQAEEERINNLEISKNIYLCINEKYYIDNIERFDDSIIKFHDENDVKYIIGTNVGQTKVYDVDNDQMYLVTVSNLYDIEQINPNKLPLPCHKYSQDEAAYLDTVLQNKIYDAGYQTRAGVVTAIRFLTLQFKYKLLYFCENGRMDTNTGHQLCDGEGRYYHVGLYLSEDKFDDIEVSSQGPAIWGCDLYEVPENRDYYNGIDCSGLVTWALLNAGFDCGDIGGGYGIDSEGFDCVDLGKAVEIKDINYSEIKAGDLIGYSGHIGMIVGIDGEKLYVGQAYWANDLEVVTYNNFQELENSEWDYIVLMDDYYLKDGNYTPVWY
ncbi:MAG: hypothetical protein Q4E33_00830 [Erysipelotrichaceae bacterium]|nr:hypothetical protein [Erysipelotrichaceae bacterium]